MRNIFYVHNKIKLEIYKREIFKQKQNKTVLNNPSVNGRVPREVKQ